MFSQPPCLCVYNSLEQDCPSPLKYFMTFSSFNINSRYPFLCEGFQSHPQHPPRVIFIILYYGTIMYTKSVDWHHFEGEDIWLMPGGQLQQLTHSNCFNNVF